MNSLKKHPLAWFENRIGFKVIQYRNFLTNMVFELTPENCKPFYLSQYDNNFRYEIHKQK